MWIPAEATPCSFSSAYSTTLNFYFTATWLSCLGFQSPSKLTTTTADTVIKTTEANFPLADCVCRRFWWKTYSGSLSRAEQRELLWGVAEAWRGRAEKQWQASLFLTLHFLQVSTHTANATCRLLRACVFLCVYVYMCVCLSRAQVCSAD